MAKTKASTKRSATAKTTKPKKKKATTKKKTPDDEVTIDRRRSDRRKKTDTKAKSSSKTKASASTTKGKSAKAAKATKAKKKTATKSTVKAESKTSTKPPQEAPKPERRKVQRRRQIDPTTCERDYSDEEIEFMHALDAYKRSSGRMFPTCSEILEVVRGLGYIKAPPAVEVAATTNDEAASELATDQTVPASEVAEDSISADGSDTLNEQDSVDDLIIAPTDFSTSDSIDANLFS